MTMCCIVFAWDACFCFDLRELYARPVAKKIEHMLSHTHTHTHTHTHVHIYTTLHYTAPCPFNSPRSQTLSPYLRFECFLHCASQSPTLTHTRIRMSLNLKLFIHSFPLQVIVPISLYVTIELVTLGQVFFMMNDIDMYHEETDRPMVCLDLCVCVCVCLRVPLMM